MKSQSGFVKLVVIFCNNEDKGEHFMSTRKTIGGALGAIVTLAAICMIKKKAKV